MPLRHDHKNRSYADPTANDCTVAIHQIIVNGTGTFVALISRLAQGTINHPVTQRGTSG